jgi:hypothetical protein
MNQFLPIEVGQVATSSPANNTIIQPDIYPTESTTGRSFESSTPQINVTLTQQANVTAVKIVTDRPGFPGNILSFILQILYENGSMSEIFYSKYVFGESPFIDFLPMLPLPKGAKLIISVTSTTNNLPATGVRIIFIFLIQEGIVESFNQSR